MRSKKTLVILFLGVLLGLHNFLYGFLINRSEIYETNSCESESVYCKYSSYKRVVLLLVDALKFEFIDPNLSQSGNFRGYIDTIRNLMNKKPKNVFVSRFISDPPTTTLQRIKGLTTGSLPTFIDISTNFGSSQLLEDNIIDQWRKSGFDLKFAGDDTWLDLFPNKFNTTKGHPSFNIKDLDSVDRKVEEFLLQHLSRPTKGSNDHPELLIGHMLGIDHCGHTFGKDHSQMKRKLDELNGFLKKVVPFIDKDTLFIMFGDHGMTISGDHGGDSVEEVDAGLFLMSGKTLNNNRIGSVISQVDFVASLAAMTGVAIPYSNLGVVQSDMLTSEGRAQYYIDLNVKQISKYINSYESAYGNLGFPNDIKEFLINSDQSANPEQSINMLQKIKQHFQSKWVQFNVPLIYSGLCLFLLNLVSLINFVAHPSFRSERDNPRFFIYLFYLILGGLELISKQYFLFICVYCLIIVLQSFHFYSNISLSNLIFFDKLSGVIFFVALVYCLLPFSNSFIVSEDRIVQFFLQTILIVKLVQCILPILMEISAWKLKKAERTASQLKYGVKINYKHWAFILVPFIFGSFCLSFGLRYKICREEQRDWCSSESLPKDKIAQISLFLIPLIVVLHRVWLRFCGNLASTDCNALVVKFLLPFSSMCLFFFHAMQFTDETSAFSDTKKMILLIFPRIVIVASFFVLMCITISPLLIYYRKPFETNNAVDIPSLFRYLRSVQSTEASITVHGLATVYSAFVFTGLLSTCIFVSVFLKSHFVIGIISTIGVLFAYSVLLNLSINVDKENIFNSLPILESIIFMVILTQYGFFATGHQTTIANIPWYSVFVGWNNDHLTRFIPAIMLNINLFSVQIVITLFGLLLPLFILLISLGPANPFKNRSVNKTVDENAESINCGDFHLFKLDSEAPRFCCLVDTYYLSYVIYHSIVTFFAILSTGYSRRHLMAWKIFAPKMIYSCVNLLVVYLMTMVSHFLIMRVHRAALKWKSKHI